MMVGNRKNDRAVVEGQRSLEGHKLQGARDTRGHTLKISRLEPRR